VNITRSKLTPPQVARRFGISPDKVVGWIRCGELRGVNIAAKPNGRPRYVVDEADLAAFEMRRAAQPKPPALRRRKAIKDVIEFF
jgi:Helix-turn-helix domain